MGRRVVVIAIDGPAASGKGVIAQAVARHYGFAHLDTGLLYRAVGWLLLGGAADEAEAVAAAVRLRRDGLAALVADESVLRREDVGALASQVAAIRRVRAELKGLQRDFAANPPGTGGAPRAGGAPASAAGAVLEGRDIGTVVCPDAQVKLYVEASLEVRARRRFLEVGAGSEAEVRRFLQARDRRDRQRPVAPLRRADGSCLLDTSELSIQESIARAIAICETQLGRAE